MIGELLGLLVEVISVFAVCFLAGLVWFGMQELWDHYQTPVEQRRVDAVFRKAHKDMERVRREQAT